MKKKISFIFGTRPEAIKLCPLILAMRDRPDIEPHVCVTGQHRQMLDQVLEVFGIAPDVDLALMQPNQTLGELTSRAIAAVDAYLGEHKPGMILVQGDTTTVFCAALCAFYHKIPVGHVEAGLRTWNKHSPFPEEMNRVLATRLADLHFAPTSTSRDNLLKEGVPADRIFVTGNTVIDALFIALNKIKTSPPDIPGLPQHLMNGSSDKPLVLITGHRRENFGGGFENICHAIAELARRFPDVHFVYPVHLNPNVREPVARLLGQIKNDPSTIHTPQSAILNQQSAISNVHLIDPLSYLPFVAMMNRATLVLTDSGGVQEEAPSLGKPVLVMRDTTERPEAVEMGTVKLVGTDAEAIIGNVSILLTDRAAYDAMANAVNPYGDGQSVGRIIAICAQSLAGAPPRC
jgi:UDP-N-acetylglucosamine 2-epimerase (non-hydrolysing)